MLINVSSVLLTLTIVNLINDVTEKVFFLLAQESLFVLLIIFFLPECKFQDCPCYSWDIFIIRAEHSSFLEACYTKLCSHYLFRISITALHRSILNRQTKNPIQTFVLGLAKVWLIIQTIKTEHFSMKCCWKHVLSYLKTKQTTDIYSLLQTQDD